LVTDRLSVAARQHLSIADLAAGINVAAGDSGLREVPDRHLTQFIRQFSKHPR
jgi:hypothetical protein